MGHFSQVLQLLIVHTQHHRGPWTVDQAQVGYLSKSYEQQIPFLSEQNDKEKPLSHNLGVQTVNLKTDCFIAVASAEMSIVYVYEGEGTSAQSVMMLHEALRSLCDPIYHTITYISPQQVIEGQLWLSCICILFSLWSFIF